MKHFAWSRALAVVASCAAASFCALVVQAKKPPPGASPDITPPNVSSTMRFVPARELLSELRSAPRDNTARERKLQSLYREAGVAPRDITLQQVVVPGGGPILHNVIARKPGATDDVIVVGGHLDKVKAGSGVIDDWSGACMAANLYQTLRKVRTRHTFVFIGFAHEERGLLGSSRYVASLPAARRKKIRAMINLECVGVDGPFIWTNGSTDSLEKLAHRVARTSKLALLDHQLHGVGADSMPFEAAGIPNITFDGLASQSFNLIHSERDQYERINPRRYEHTYHLVTRFLLALDSAPSGKKIVTKTLRAGVGDNAQDDAL